MRSDWILDVLTDLKTFATANDLPVLAEQLDDTAIVALAEIAALHDKMQGNAHVEERNGGSDFGGAGAGRHA
ncbi:hypothetical protein R5H30_13900 [Sulfitobacter sp. D35]|uniref:hypothetical protein n=1 Tax=Sulfitobacter sp. D35 TaxID=3083252 RepID=UPI00296F629E|nr:hypothetical protein [Sulfitobacter sp. D35]MDW4499085.1 hypothetical protein [Sulfitobacter sp. D35]